MGESPCKHGSYAPELCGECKDEKIAALEAELAARDAKIAESERELAALRDVISAGDVDFPLWCRIQYAVKGDETFSRAKCTDAVEHISRELAELRRTNRWKQAEGD